MKKLNPTTITLNYPWTNVKFELTDPVLIQKYNENQQLFTYYLQGSIGDVFGDLEYINIPAVFEHIMKKKLQFISEKKDLTKKLEDLCHSNNMKQQH